MQIVVMYGSLNSSDKNMTVVICLRGERHYTTTMPIVWCYICSVTKYNNTKIYHNFRQKLMT